MSPNCPLGMGTYLHKNILLCRVHGHGCKTKRHSIIQTNRHLVRQIGTDYKNKVQQYVASLMAV